MTQVVNFHAYGSAAALEAAFGARWLYIGRAAPAQHLPASPLANPFRVRDHGGQRGATLPLYRRWLWEQLCLDHGPVWEALRAVDDQTVLVCWCKPGPCHGDVVHAAAAWLRRKETAFVSGHRDLSEAEFAQHYAPALDRAVANDHRFAVGDAAGADALAQRYLAERLQPDRITVYHAYGRPRHALPGLRTQGGFADQTAKDAAMTAVSGYDIAWVRPGREQSGTARNLARRPH